MADSAGTDAAVELAVSGMHCQSCASLIEETLARDPGVRRAAVDLEAGRASVAYDPGALSVEALCAAVTAAGYPATLVASGDPAAPC
jgi:copper chaperone CopZ